MPVNRCMACSSSPAGRDRLARRIAPATTTKTHWRSAMDGDKRRYGFWNPTPTRHTPLEDAQGLFASSMIAALGLALMSSAGLVARGSDGADGLDSF